MQQESHIGATPKSSLFLIPEKGLKDTKMARVVVLAEVVEVALLDLETGGRDAGARPQPIAVFAEGGPEVQLEPGLGKLYPLLPVTLDQGDRSFVDLSGVARMKGVQEHPGRVYGLGNSRSMSAR